MVPQQYLVPYLISNAVALAVLVLAFRRPGTAKWIWVGIFIWAAVINSLTALQTPWVYLAYGALTPSEAYRGFIGGWFSGHIQPMVLSIAAGQVAIALLLARADRMRRLGVAGAVIFLLAIAPLGVGSAFPFSLTAAVSLLVMERRIAAAARQSVSPAAAFVTHPDVQDEHTIDVRAPSGLVFEVAREVNLLGDPVVAANDPFVISDSCQNAPAASGSPSMGNRIILTGTPRGISETASQ
jgi:hypothetical protein